MALISQTVITMPVLVLVGPTAVGKTALTIDLAHEFSCEIISMDSMQVYRFMNIGTAKPGPEEQGGVPHHLIDIIDPDEQYSAACFIRDCLQKIQEIHGRGKIPLITGGTGLYLSSLVNGLFGEIKVTDEHRDELKVQLEQQGRAHLFNELRRIDPQTAARIHPNDTQRLLRGLEIYRATGVPWSAHIRQQQTRKKPTLFRNIFQMGLCCDRKILYRRIRERADQMLDAGLIQEVRMLQARGYVPELPSMQAIGYRHVCNLIDCHWNRQETREKLIRDTRRYAKRQLTWFRKQRGIVWFDWTNSSKGVVRAVREFLA